MKDSANIGRPSPLLTTRPAAVAAAGAFLRATAERARQNAGTGMRRVTSSASGLFAAASGGSRGSFGSGNNLQCLGEDQAMVAASGLSLTSASDVQLIPVAQAQAEAFVPAGGGRYCPGEPV